VSTFSAVVWTVMLLATVLVIVPILLILLSRAVGAARNIERYTAEALVGGVAIADNTGDIPALKDTIGVATQLLAGAGAIKDHTDRIHAALSGTPDGQEAG
jgi:hypothetical protein